MIKKLLIIGLIVIPFYELVLYLLLPDTQMPKLADMRITKEYVSITLASAISLLVAYEVGLNKIKNRSAYVFLFLILFSAAKVPFIEVPYNGLNINTFWNYKPMLQLVIYFMLTIAVASCTFEKRFIDLLFKIILYSSTAMACYMALQALGLDQLFNLVSVSSNSLVQNPRVGGFIGQPTLAAPLLLMSIPFAYYFKNIFAFVVITVAVVLTGSSFGVAGLGVVLTCLAIERFGAKAIPPLIMLALVLLAYLAFHPHVAFLKDNGRFETWKVLLTDVFHGNSYNPPFKISLTGAGLGAFLYVFQIVHTSSWAHAHNEYLQVMWCCGLIGFVVFMLTLFSFLKTCYKYLYLKEVRFIGYAFLPLAFCALGTFVWQLGVYQYYTAVLVGLTYQLTRIEESHELAKT